MVPPPPSRHPAAGQASLEYAGLLTLVVAVLAAASPAAAGLSGLGAQVARAVRTGVCIVGGDICRPADALAAGLEPCTLSETLRGAGLAGTVLSLRAGKDKLLTIARRSDGSVSVTHTEGREAGLSGGLGLAAGTVEAGIDGTVGLQVAAAVGWELPDAAAAASVVRDVQRNLVLALARHRPAWRSGEAGLAATGWAGLGARAGKGAAGMPAGGIELTAETAAGARIGRGTTTLFLRTETDGPAVDLPGARSAAGRRGPVMVEYTTDAAGPRELAFRAAAPARAGRELVETVARMDLRDPASRALADRLLRLRPPWGAGDELRAAIRHAAATGIVERNVYRIADRTKDVEVALRLGVEIGLELEYTSVDRTLVAATATTAGSAQRAREDCLTT